MQNIPVDWKQSFKFWVTPFIILVGAWIIYQSAHFITLCVISFLIVYCILPLVKILANRNIPYGIAVVFSYLLAIGVVVAFFYLIVPTLIKELGQLTVYASTELVPFLTELENKFDMEITQDLTSYLATFMETVPSYLQDILITLSSVSARLVSVAWSIMSVMFLVLYLMLDMRLAQKRFTKMFSPQNREKVIQILVVVNEKVGDFIRGNVFKCAVVGVMTGVSLMILGFPFPMMMGVLAGVLNIVFYIGPFLAAVPAVLIGLLPDTPHVLAIALIYIVIQSIDAYVFAPVILGRAVNLSPLTIVVVIIIGEELAGLMGIILSVPLAAIVSVLYEIYVKKDEEIEEDDKQEKKVILESRKRRDLIDGKVGKYIRKNRYMRRKQLRPKKRNPRETANQTGEVPPPGMD